MFFGLQKFYALPFACADVRVFVLGMNLPQSLSGSTCLLLTLEILLNGVDSCFLIRNFTNLFASPVPLTFSGNRLTFEPPAAMQHLRKDYASVF